MVPEGKPGAQSCVEVLAVAFGDTIIDVAHVDEHTPSYRIGEGEGVRVPVSGDGLPDSAAFVLLRAAAGGFWLGFTASMHGVVIDRQGRRSLEQLVVEGHTVAADGAHQLLLEDGQTVWVEHHGVRFRARLVPREAVHASTWTVDRPYLGSLGASAAVVLAFLMLARAQPPPFIDEDQHRAVLARLLPREPEPPEPVPGPPSETRSRELGVEDRAVASTPLPRPPDPRVRGSKHARPLWVPASPAQAVGQLGRSYDPVEAARHAGILGVLDNRPFVQERVFDPEVDDAQLWAATSEIGPSWMASFGVPWTRERDGATGLIGVGSYGSLGHPTGEGVIGWGSYGSLGTARWRERVDEDPQHAALCSDDCRQPTRPRPTIVHFGRIEVHGGMDRDIVRRIARAHANELRSCFDQTITARTAEFAGEVEFSLSRAKVGAVVTDPAFPDALAGCMQRAIRRWRFPVGSSHETNMVTVSLRLSR